MGRFPTMSFIQVLGMLLIFMCSITFSMGTVVSLDRLTNLETKFFQIEEKNIQMEDKYRPMNLRRKTSIWKPKSKNKKKMLIALLVESYQSGSKSIFGNHQTAIR